MCPFLLLYLYYSYIHSKNSKEFKRNTIVFVLNKFGKITNDIMRIEIHDADTQLFTI